MPDTETQETWVFLVPVEGIQLTSAVKYEFRIKRVLLVDSRKLPRIRKRLRIPCRISELKKKAPHWSIYSHTGTFAVLHTPGNPEELRTKCLRIVTDELALFSASQLGWSRRRYNAHPRVTGPTSFAVVKTAFLNTENKSATFMQRRRIWDIERLKMDSDWLNYQKRFSFFFPLLDMIRSKASGTKSWRECLERSMLLAGRSQCSDDVSQAFLLNMIAIEMLLTRQGDKYVDALPSRAEALLGWVGFWETEGYADKIRNVYKKRCALVHDGRTDQIEIADLLFTDDLLFNLIVNLVRHPRLFSSKEDVLEFAKKVEAEHLLGITPKTRPKTFAYTASDYNDRDLQQI